jgi:hypothetical protein
MKEEQEHIDNVFGTNPRDGYGPEKFWWEKRGGDDKFFELLYSRGKSICVDGPTGSGKTSLVMRGLKESKNKFCTVTVFPQLDWKSLCKEIIQVPKSHKEDGSFGTKVGFKQQLPESEFGLNINKNYAPSSDMVYTEKYLNDFTQQHLAGIMQETNATLFLDDFENASTELIKRVASLIKILSTSSNKTAAKVILTASDNSFTKLVSATETIEKRLVAFNLGGLRGKWQGWNFICEGLTNLNIIHPATSKMPTQKSRLAACETAVYDAAGGILKNLTYLGQKLATEGYARKSVTVDDILKICEEVSKEGVSSNSMRYRPILKHVKEDPAIRVLLRYIYKKGIGGIQYLQDIVTDLEGQAHEDTLRSGIKKFVNEKVLVQTGFDGGVLFPKNPSVLHYFCVACSNPNKYNAPKEFRTEPFQLLIPFEKNENESEN